MQRYLLATLFGLAYASAASGLCSDQDAKAAAEARGQGYFRQSEVFHAARVLKRHSPSGHKEVAVYLKTGQRRYSLFFLVSHDCTARFIKRTRQGD